MSSLQELTGTYRNMRQLHHQQNSIPTWVTTAWVIWVADFTGQSTLACVTTHRCFITGVLPLVILPLPIFSRTSQDHRQEVWNSGLWCSYLLLRVSVNNPIIIIINLGINMLFAYFITMTVELKFSIGRHNNLGSMMVIVIVVLGENSYTLTSTA